MTDRLFFALWPDDAIRADIAHRLPAWTAGLDGRLQRPAQWHVTLAFLGEIAVERQPDLRAIAGGQVVPRCALEFDRLEHWPKPRVGCLVAAQVPAALAGFVASLRAALAANGFASDPRPFQAHVTLARKVRAMQVIAVRPPLRWPAAGFALVRSVTDEAGSRYEPIGCWNGAD